MARSWANAVKRAADQGSGDSGTAMSADPEYYTAYGLSIRSEVALPCQPVSPAAEPDLPIRFGALPALLDASADLHGLWQSMPGRSLFNVHGVARFPVKDGREIVVESGHGSLSAARTFLLGSVLAACLQQRGIVTLHASAIATDAGAVTVCRRLRQWQVHAARVVPQAWVHDVGG